MSRPTFPSSLNSEQPSLFEDEPTSRTPSAIFGDLRENSAESLTARQNSNDLQERVSVPEPLDWNLPRSPSPSFIPPTLGEEESRSASAPLPVSSPAPDLLVRSESVPPPSQDASNSPFNPPNNSSNDLRQPLIERPSAKNLRTKVWKLVTCCFSKGRGE